MPSLQERIPSLQQLDVVRREEVIKQIQDTMLKVLRDKGSLEAYELVGYVANDLHTSPADVSFALARLTGLQVDVARDNIVTLLP